MMLETECGVVMETITVLPHHQQSALLSVDISDNRQAAAPPDTSRLRQPRPNVKDPSWPCLVPLNFTEVTTSFTAAGNTFYVKFKNQNKP